MLVVWQVILHNAGGSGEPPKTFTFDQVYDDTSQQEVTHTHIRHPDHADRMVFAAAAADFDQDGRGKHPTNLRLS